MWILSILFIYMYGVVHCCILATSALPTSTNYVLAFKVPMILVAKYSAYIPINALNLYRMKIDFRSYRNL